MIRISALSGCVLLALSGCVKVERESGAEPLVRTQLLASGTVSAVDGGELWVTEDGEFAGAGIVFPPGAVATDREVEIFGHFGDPRLPTIVQTLEFRSSDSRLLAPAAVTIRYSSVYAATAGDELDEREISVYAFSAGPTLDERALEVAERDVDRDLIQVTADQLGTFYGIHSTLRSLVSQPTRLIDPAVPLTAELIGNRVELSHEGRIRVQIGHGALDSFWASPAERNVLVVPGLLADPLLVTTAGGLVPADPDGGLKRDFENVVVFQYPTGRSLRESANHLYDALVDGARPGFGCNIVGHGSGGLVVRYALERAHSDASRAGYVDGQPQLDALVDAVVLLGTPHQGAAVAQSRFGFLLSAVFEPDLQFVAGILDLLPRQDGFVSQLNTDWQRPRSRYFAIAGDSDGNRSDGLVDVTSAIGVPRTYSRPDAHLVFSGPIYEHASLILFARPIGVLDQTLEWLGKSRASARPVVGAVHTPSALVSNVVEIPISVSDADSATCVLSALISVDGSDWQLATPLGGSGAIRLSARPAPGENHVFRWDSAADRVGEALEADVVMRFLVTDGTQLGTPGQTGTFVVDNRTR